MRCLVLLVSAAALAALAQALHAATPPGGPPSGPKAPAGEARPDRVPPGEDLSAALAGGVPVVLKDWRLTQALASLARKQGLEARPYLHYTWPGAKPVARETPPATGGRSGRSAGSCHCGPAGRNTSSRSRARGSSALVRPLCRFPGHRNGDAASIDKMG